MPLVALRILRERTHGATQRRRPSLATEPKVNWFLESTRPEAVKGRRVVNDLYSRFADGDDRMYADLRSSRRIPSSSRSTDGTIRRVCGTWRSGFSAPSTTCAPTPARCRSTTWAHPKGFTPQEQLILLFRFLALADSYAVEDGDRIVLGGASIGGCVDSALRLRERLDDKAIKYDLRGKPFVIVVGVRDSMCDLDEVHQALTGTPAIMIPSREGVRKGDGFFRDGGDRADGKHQRVSAVFSIHDWYPGGPYVPRITRFDNPFAAAPIRPMRCPSAVIGARSNETRSTSEPAGSYRP